MSNQHKGSTLDNFLEEEGLLAEVEATAVKRVIAFKIKKVMQEQQMNKTKMAGKMHTSRAALERLLDPGNTSVTLQTLVRAANVIGKKLHIELRD